MDLWDRKRRQCQRKKEREVSKKGDKEKARMVSSAMLGNGRGAHVNYALVLQSV